MNFKSSIITLILLTAVAACTKYEAKNSSSSGFNEQVNNIVSEKCVKCHASPNSNGGLDFIDNPQRLIDNGYISPGNPEQSLIYQKVSNPPYGEKMPKGGPYLNSSELTAIYDWINGLSSACGSLSAATVSFQNDIRPILEQAHPGNTNKCITCHKVTSPSAGFSMTNDGTTVDYTKLYNSGRFTPCNSTASKLCRKLTTDYATTGSSRRMPRGGPVWFTDDALGAEKIRKICTWIDEGARDN